LYPVMKAKKQGSILVLTLWTLGLLSVFAVYLGVGLRQRLEFLDRLETRNKSYHIAHAGVKQALSVIGNFQKDSAFTCLRDTWSNNEGAFSEVALGQGAFTVGYTYRMGDFSDQAPDAETERLMYGAADVEGKLNINTAPRKELSRLFELATSLDSYAADGIASCIIDWRDNDSLSLPNGAEDKYYRGLRYPYECKDAAFQSIEELQYVKGMSAEVFLKIKPYITVYGSGKLNINTAYRMTLRAVGIGEKLTEKILRYRCGEDKTEANADDRVFTAPGSIVAQLSQVYPLSAAEVAQLSNLVSAGRFSVFSDTFLIQSTAGVGRKKGKCRIECVLKKDLDVDSEKAGIILSWRMHYII